MPTKTILLAYLLILNASAFKITTYSSKQCSGLSSTIELGPEDGCNAYRAGEAQAMIIPWLSELDDNTILVTYSDINCCHADMIEVYGWEDQCTPLGGLGVMSWRVIDPEDPDRGKPEEIDNYACRTCGSNDCGTIEPGHIPNLPQ